MRPVRRQLALFALLPACVAGISACGEEGIELAKSDENRRGAELFAARCSGCHTFEPAGSQGSAADNNVGGREETDGPNFDTRPETVNGVLYAIRNGGFSGGIMPQNIVVGDDARAVAEFVAKYAGRKAPGRVSPKAPPPAPLP